MSDSEKLNVADVDPLVDSQKELNEELFEHFSLSVDKGQSLLRIDKFLTSRMEGVSRARIQSAADNGYVMVNHTPVKSSYRVKPLDEIRLMMPYERRDTDIIAQDIPIDVIYEDDVLLVVNKQAGMVVHPGFGNYDGTLVNALAYRLLNSPTPGIKPEQFNDVRAGLVHRIDKNTSGLLVVAKDVRSHAFLAAQFACHSIERTYHALVWGVPAQPQGTITTKIGRSPRERLQMAVLPDDDPNGKVAITHYRVLESLGYVSLVECKLETGRTHQIRVHMRHLGHPLFNDERYGGDKILRGTTHNKYRQFVENCFALMPRHGLHALTLGFTHPISGQRLSLTNEYPADFADCLQKWRSYGVLSNG